MIVTTSGFTKAARDLADEFGDIDLVDGEALGVMAGRQASW